MGFLKTLTALLFLVFSATLAAETQKIAQIGGEISIDADGTVKAISLTNVKDAKFEMYFIEKIKTWSFYPLEINGKPIEATSKFTFDLIATYLPGNKLKQIEFANVSFGQSALETDIRNKNGYKRGKMGHINYPLEAARIGAEANIVIALDVTAEGKVKKAEVFSIELINTARTSNGLVKAFVNNALKGVRLKEFSKDELAESQCMTGCISTFKVEFRMDAGSVWKSYARVPVAPIPWVVVDELKNLNETEQSQLVRLKDDPTGKPIDSNG